MAHAAPGCIVLYTPPPACVCMCVLVLCVCVTHSVTMSQPHGGNSSVSEPHTHSVTVSEPHGGNSSECEGSRVCRDCEEPVATHVYVLCMFCVPSSSAFSSSSSLHLHPVLFSSVFPYSVLTLHYYPYSLPSFSVLHPFPPFTTFSHLSPLSPPHSLPSLYPLLHLSPLSPPHSLPCSLPSEASMPTKVTPAVSASEIMSKMKVCLSSY